MVPYVWHGNNEHRICDCGVHWEDVEGPSFPEVIHRGFQLCNVFIPSRYLTEHGEPIGFTRA